MQTPEAQKLSRPPRARHLSPDQKRALAEIHWLVEVFAIRPAEMAPRGTQPRTLSLVQEVAARKAAEIMAFWDIKLHELRDRRAGPAGPIVSKYAHPVTGATWTGRGPQPQWLKDALTVEGYTVAQVRCAPAQMDNALS